MAFSLTGPGFLGTRATFRSDVTLALMLFTAVLFTIGWRLAVHKRYEAHRWVQTTAVAMNTLGILVTMIGSFAVNIRPGIPSKLLEGSYGIPTVHALVGMVASVLGVFVVLRANNLVPRSLRFKNYKRVMRISYALYMLATLVGVAVYVVLFVFGF